MSKTDHALDRGQVKYLMPDKDSKSLIDCVSEKSPKTTKRAQGLPESLQTIKESLRTIEESVRTIKESLWNIKESLWTIKESTDYKRVYGL